MNAQFKATNPEMLVFEATFRLTLAEWRRFKDQIQSSDHMHPCYDFKCAIQDMISQAERTYYPEVVEK